MMKLTHLVTPEYLKSPLLTLSPCLLSLHVSLDAVTVNGNMSTYRTMSLLAGVLHLICHGLKLDIPSIYAAHEVK